MKRAVIFTTAFLAIAAVVPTRVAAQVAGQTVLGVAAAEWGEVMQGWSARKTILGAAV